MKAGRGGPLAQGVNERQDRLQVLRKIRATSQVPVLIRSGEESSQLKLEMAIIENLQREDLNPVDRARSFKRLAEEFKLNMPALFDLEGLDGEEDLQVPA